MTADILAFRISRRAVAVAALDGEELTFCDSRHLTSGADRAVRAADRYVENLVTRFKPRLVALYAPTTSEGVTRTVTNLLTHTLQASGTSVRVIDRPSLFGAFGTTAPKDRRALHTTILDIWPRYRELTARLQPYVADAAAAALVAEAEVALEGPT